MAMEELSSGSPEGWLEFPPLGHRLADHHQCHWAALLIGKMAEEIGQSGRGFLRRSGGNEEELVEAVADGRHPTLMCLLLGPNARDSTQWVDSWKDANGGRCVPIPIARGPVSQRCQHKHRCFLQRGNGFGRGPTKTKREWGFADVWRWWVHPLLAGTLCSVFVWIPHCPTLFIQFCWPAITKWRATWMKVPRPWGAIGKGPPLQSLPAAVAVCGNKFLEQGQNKKTTIEVGIGFVGRQGKWNACNVWFTALDGPYTKTIMVLAIEICTITNIIVRYLGRILFKINSSAGSDNKEMACSAFRILYGHWVFRLFGFSYFFCFGLSSFGPLHVASYSSINGISPAMRALPLMDL